jgi:uncharacterized protein
MSNRVRKFRNLTLFGLISLLIALVFGLCYREVQAWLYPIRTPVQPLSDESPFIEVAFQTEDDLTIYGWYTPPDSGQVILMLHGHTGTRDHFMVHSDYLIEAGYGVLAIDFRNSGDSDGDITSMGYYEIRDARAAYDFLLTQDDIQKIVIMGHSMGGAVASQLMQEVDADGLIIDATYADFPSIVRNGVIARGYPATPITEILVTMAGALSQADWYSLRPIDYLASVDKPMLWLHGTDDSTIPIENAYQMIEANPLIKLVVFEGGGHSDLYQLDPELYRNELLSYLNAVFD